MKEGFQFTLLSLRIGKVLIEQPHGKHWNYGVAQAVDHDPSVTYNTLRQMESQGWLRAKKERVDPEMRGRPARVFYYLTESGAQAVTAALLALQLSTAYMLAQAAAHMKPPQVFSTIAVSS